MSVQGLNLLRFDWEGQAPLKNSQIDGLSKLKTLISETIPTSTYVPWTDNNDTTNNLMTHKLSSQHPLQQKLLKYDTKNQKSDDGYLFCFVNTQISNKTKN